MLYAKLLRIFFDGWMFLNVVTPALGMYLKFIDYNVHTFPIIRWCAGITNQQRLQQFQIFRCSVEQASICMNISCLPCIQMRTGQPWLFIAMWDTLIIPQILPSACACACACGYYSAWEYVDFDYQLQTTDQGTHTQMDCFVCVCACSCTNATANNAQI